MMSGSRIFEGRVNGGTEGFRKIMDEYKPKAFAMSLNILGNREDAEDVCQDAVMRAYQNIKTYNPQKSFASWFYTIVYNRCMDILRKRRRFRDYVKREERRFDSQVAEPVDGRLTMYEKHVKNIMSILSAKERTVLYLWASDRFSGEEIARILKCSQSTARVHLYKARKKIKKMMER